MAAFDQHLHGTIRQFQQLQHRADGTDGEDVGRGRIVLRSILLGDEQDLLIILHDVFQRPHRFLAPHKERHDHVRKHHDVTQRQNRILRRCLRFLHDSSNR